jgi:hypothetical protein
MEMEKSLSGGEKVGAMKKPGLEGIAERERH